MKRLFDSCRGRRRSLALLVAGALAEPERDELAKHLAGCARCRSQLTEWRGAVAPLVELAAGGGEIQPSEAAKDRWTRAIRTAAHPASARRVAATDAPGWWREVVWSSRRAWAGLAAVWLLILAGNLALHDQPRTLAGKRSPASREVVMAFKERQVILAEILGDQSHLKTSEAVRPKAAPRPRTQHTSEGMG